MLSEDAGRVERGRRRGDVAVAATVEDVVDPFVHEQVELGHHRLDGFLVGHELGDGAGTLLGGRLQSLLLGTLGDDSFFVTNRGEYLGLDSLVQGRADALGNVGRGANVVLRQSQIGQCGRGLPRGNQIACRLEPLLDVAGKLLAGDVVFPITFLQRGLGPCTGLRLIGTGCRGGGDDRNAGDRLTVAGGCGHAGGRRRDAGSRRRRCRPGRRLSRCRLLEGNMEHAVLLRLGVLQSPGGVSITGIKRQRLLKEGLGHRRGPLGKRLTPQVVQLRGQRWAVVTECHDPGQQHATQRQ